MDDQPEHGDAYDHADIPGPANLSERYRDSLRSDAAREAIAKRTTERDAQVRADATPGVAGWMLIENEGALFRGPGRGNPMEVWNPGTGWRPYAGAGRPRGVEWGDELTVKEASQRMAEREAHAAKR